MTPTVYLLPGALTQLDKSHSPAISLCSERWSMTAIRMLNSPLARYPRRFNAAARLLRFSRRVPLDPSGWGDALVLQCAKFILSLMKARSFLPDWHLMRWWHCDRGGRETCAWHVRAGGSPKRSEMTSVHSGEARERLSVLTGRWANIQTGICVVWPQIRHQELFEGVSLFTKN